MLIFQPPVDFCSDEGIQTIFGIGLEDFLNYRIDYNSISQTVEKVVKKIFLGRRNNSTSSGRQSSAIVGSTKVLDDRLQPFSEDTFGGDAQQRYFVRPVHC
jgi:hypothetical protein